MNAGTLNIILNIVGLLLGGTALGAILHYRLGMRKLTVEDEADQRDDYAVELAALRNERRQDREDALKIEKHLRDMIELSDTRHAECEDSRRAMRVEVDEMHAEIAGLKRQIPEVSADALLKLEGNGKPSETAPHAAAAAARVKKITEGK